MAVRFTAIPSCKYRWVASVLFSGGPFSAFVSPGSTLSVAQKVRVWHLDCYSSWWHSQGLRWRRCCSALSLLNAAKISYFFQNCNSLSRYPRRYCIQDIAVWKIFRKVRRSRCCSCRWSIVVILGWTCWSSASGSSLGWRIPCAGASQTSRSTSWSCSHALYHAIPLSKVVCHEFCCLRRCSRFLRDSVNRLVGPKMILLLGCVALVAHIANSIWEQIVALLESSEPSRRAPPVFSYIPLSQCKLQVVCCRERLHVTSFGKKCKPFSWASFKLHQNAVFWRRFQVFLYGAILGFVRSHGVSPMPCTSSIGFTEVKKTACLPLLKLVPPGFNSFLIIEFDSFAFPTWRMYSVNPFGNSTLSCNAGSIARSPECPWIARRYKN